MIGDEDGRSAVGNGFHTLDIQFAGYLERRGNHGVDYPFTDFHSVRLMPVGPLGQDRRRRKKTW
jgi:hypothetical protein